MINQISPELSEILGLLCAEGSHIISYSNYLEKNGQQSRYRYNKRSERIEFYNKDQKLVQHYTKNSQKTSDFSRWMNGIVLAIFVS